MRLTRWRQGEVLGKGLSAAAAEGEWERRNFTKTGCCQWAQDPSAGDIPLQVAPGSLGAGSGPSGVALLEAGRTGEAPQQHPGDPVSVRPSVRAWCCLHSWGQHGLGWLQPPAGTEHSGAGSWV